MVMHNNVMSSRFMNIVFTGSILSFKKANNVNYYPFIFYVYLILDIKKIILNVVAM